MAVLNNILAGAAGQTGGAPVAGYEIERSLRFNSADSAYLGATFGTPTDQDVFTLSMWVKRSALDSTQQLFGVSTNHSFGFTSGDALNLTFGGSSALTTTALFRDPSAWYHVVWKQNGTTHELYVNNVSVGTATATSNTFNTGVAHQIGAAGTTNYLNGYLADVHFIDGQALAPTNFGEFDDNGVWQPKAYTGTYGTNGFHLPFDDNSSAAALGTDTSGNGNDWTVNNFLSNAVTVLYGEDVNDEGFDDNSTSLTLDTTGYSYSALTASPYQVSGQAAIARVIKSSDGSSFTATFTTTSSERFIWTSSNGINWSSPGTEYQTSSTPAVITAAWIAWAGGASAPTTSIEFNVPKNVDSLFDSPTNGTQTDTGAGGEVRGNYATLNPLSKGSAVTLSDGNLQHYSTDSSWSGPSVALCGFGMTAGKWYWECTISTHQYSYIGIAQIDKTHSYIGGNSNSCGYLTSNGAFVGGGAQTASPAVVYTPNATLMFAYDADAKKFWVGQNGTWFSVGGNAGDPANGNYPSHSGFGSNGEVYTAATSTYSTVTTKFNFGQRPFAYTAPSGFKALCTANLPSTTITTSGSFTGNSSTDGPFIYLNGVPTAMTINSNSVTFGTHADKLSNGFKVRNSTSSYNQSGSNTYSITSTGDAFKNARAQTNP